MLECLGKNGEFIFPACIYRCAGPEVPSSVLVDVATNTIVYILDTNSELRALFASMAKPQIRTIQVEMESGYHAQVRLFLPPGLREHEDMTFPLILHVYVYNLIENLVQLLLVSGILHRELSWSKTSSMLIGCGIYRGRGILLSHKLMHEVLAVKARK